MPTALLAVLALAYPVLVYVGLLYLPIKWVALAIALLLVARVALLQRTTQRKSGSSPFSLAPALVLAIVCAGLSVIMNDAGALKMVPVVINCACLIGFASTLRHPPSMIERFARLQETHLDEAAITYTRQVTRVWCVFFVINGSIAFYTAMFTDMATWTLYNGLIAYLLMGLLFIVEYGIRLRVKARSTRTH